MVNRGNDVDSIQRHPREMMMVVHLKSGTISGAIGDYQAAMWGKAGGGGIVARTQAVTSLVSHWRNHSPPQVVSSNATRWDVKLRGQNFTNFTGLVKSMNSDIHPCHSGNISASVVFWKVENYLH
jgi:hypothetical protein